jgi:hypothetical protein
MSTAPRLTIGLPVYNGKKYAAESHPGAAGQDESVPVPHPDIPVDSIVAGRQGRLS